eukprot:5270919-Alexandrium_andersonii.AAC.1
MAAQAVARPPAQAQEARAGLQACHHATGCAPSAEAAPWPGLRTPQPQLPQLEPSSCPHAGGEGTQRASRPQPEE